MTWYAEVTAMQSPFDSGLDAAGRATVTFNVLTMKRPSDDVTGEIVKKLEDASVGTRNSTIYASTARELPAGDGPFLSVTETGGPAPVRRQNKVAGTPAYERPTLQIMAHARSFAAAMTLSKAAYAALGGIRNTELSA